MEDIDFKKCSLYMDMAISLWEKSGGRPVDKAEEYYQKAMEIFNQHYADKKEVLTEDLCPF
jgi:hypothetical protein